MNERADIAISMLAKLPGTRVFPLPPSTKTPQGGSWKTSSSDNPETIRAWFDILPEANVGFVIGDRVAVIDVEGPKKKNEKAREGMANLSGLEQTLGELPPTLTSETPSGGRHLYYMLPDGVTFNRKAQLLGREGVEFRTGMHYVLLPPSRIDNAKEGVGDYVFADGLGLDDVEVATLPDAWVEAIRKYDEPKEAVPSRLAELFPATAGGSDKKPQFDTIADGCAFIRHVVEDAATVTEPEWYAALSIAGHCEKGREVAHKISEPYPGYSAAETDRKVEHAVTAAKPATCQYIANGVGFEGCARCPFRASAMNSPISLGYQKEHLVKEQVRLIYVASVERYFDITTGRQYTRTALNDMLAHRVGKGPHSQLVASKTMPKVEYADYLAGNDQLIVDADGYKVLNLFWRDGVEPCEGDATELLKFLTYLIPDETSREHLLDYLAQLLQRRGEKIAHALIVTGPQGTGKSTLNRIVQKLFGRNARKVEGEQLGSRWTEALVNCEVLIAEEAMHGERYETYERLKEFVTGDTYTAEQKHMATYQARTPRGMIIASNHDNPLAITANDRRFCVIATADEKATEALYEAINRAIDDDQQMGAFASALLKRDLSKFNPKAAPPVTDAKKIAIAASRTPLGQAIEDAIESGRLWQDIVTLTQIKRALDQGPWFVGNVTPHKIAKELKARGAVKLDRVRTPDGLDRPWAIREVARWRAASPKEIKDEMFRPIPAEQLAQMPKVVALAVQAAIGGQEGQ